MILCVKLSNGVCERVLNYQLYNNQLVVEWLQLFAQVTKHKNFSLKVDFHCQQSVDKINLIFSQFKEFLHTLNIDIQFDMLNINKMYVNNLFRLGNAIDFKNPKDKIYFYDLLYQLDDYVVIKRKKVGERYDYVVVNLMPIMRKTFVDEQFYEYFQDYIEFGDLCMAFGETSKNLYQCYTRNDIESIQNGTLRVQTEFTTQFVMHFRSVKMNKKIMNRRFLKWCEKNKVDQYGVDYLSLKHQAKWGKLGKLIQDYAFDIYETIENYQNIVDIWLENDRKNEKGRKTGC